MVPGFRSCPMGWGPVLLTLLTAVALKLSDCLCVERAGFGTEQINDKSSVGVTWKIFPTM